MASTFAQLRKNSQAQLEKLAEAANSKNKKNYVDEEEGYWKLTRDASGTGYATIRFLPAPPNEDMPYATYWSYAFKNKRNGMWYIERSLATFNEPDPVFELNGRLYNGSESDKEQAKTQKRKLNHVAHILVVDDPANPENNGKVFKFKYGAAIQNMINDKLSPEFEDTEAVNVFDLFDGANLKLRIRQKDDFPSYDKSQWEEKSAVGSDEFAEELWTNLPPLESMVNDRKFYKTYEKLEERLNRVLGLTQVETKTKAKTAAPSEEKRSEAKVTKKAETKIEEEDAPWDSSGDDDDDDLAFFKKLQNEDE